MEKIIYLAGGCFWGTEEYFSRINGVTGTQVGYANGKTKKPTYEAVCKQNTGHAEVVAVTYNRTVLSLQTLLSLYYEVIDPTSVNRQGGDIGTQYRTGIYYVDKADLPIIKESIAELQQSYTQPIAIEVELLHGFYPAEAYHQRYLVNNPHGYCHIGAAQFKKAEKANRPVNPYTPKTDAELTELQYYVVRESGTEPPYKNAYYNNFQPGIYVSIVTGEPLFISSSKFDSGCGWPAFSKPISKTLLTEIKDNTMGMTRTEVRSKNGNAHLGHVFSDGPPESGGLRYCINSAALQFIPKSEMAQKGYGDYLPFVENET